jgi:hypothetical protein
MKKKYDGLFNYTGFYFENPEVEVGYANYYELSYFWKNVMDNSYLEG